MHDKPDLIELIYIDLPLMENDESKIKAIMTFLKRKKRHFTYLKTPDIEVFLLLFKK